LYEIGGKRLLNAMMFKERANDSELIKSLIIDKAWDFVADLAKHSTSTPDMAGG
jgi:hypothetical protein